MNRRWLMIYLCSVALVALVLMTLAQQAKAESPVRDRVTSTLNVTYIVRTGTITKPGDTVVVLPGGTGRAYFVPKH